MYALLFGKTQFAITQFDVPKLEPFVDMSWLCCNLRWPEWVSNVQRRTGQCHCTVWPLRRQPPRDPLNLQQVIIHRRTFCDDILCAGSKFLLPVDKNVTLPVQSPKRASTGKAARSLQGLKFWQEMKSCGMWCLVAGPAVTGVSKDRGAFIFVVKHYKEDEDGGATIFRSR